VVGMLISIATAYLVMNAASIMDYVQALFSFFIAPLFGTVILGMLWKRATNWGGFWGLLAGTVSSIGMFIYTSGTPASFGKWLYTHQWAHSLSWMASIGQWLYNFFGGAQAQTIALAHIALSTYAQPQAENMFRALWSWLICVAVTVIVSLMTKGKTDAELNGLVYGATVIPHDGATTLWQKPIFWAGVVSVVFIALNIIFF